MTATDDLRRLLDERGARWTACSKATIDNQTFCYGYTYTEFKDGLMVTSLTTEQAVEATLGRGECRDSNNRFNAWQCSECGATVLLMFDDFDEPTYSVGGVAEVPKYCPNCGRKVVDE